MVFTKNDNFDLVWSNTEIIKNTKNINGVQIKMAMSPGLTPLTGCRIIIKNSVTNKNL
jgi:hypothetical protein